ncbi:Retrovirus-related Pol polyprotein, partial [Mucuna pruriens]
MKSRHDEMVLTRIQNSWQVCIDYQKLNQVTHKDHFPLPFIDQSHYCFLDGFFGFLQIHIAPMVSIRLPSLAHSVHSVTPECHLGCATLRVHSRDDCMEVFIDDFTVYAKSFEACLENLSQVLTRYIETNHVLNFEKCHFMVTGELYWDISHKAKANIITSLPNHASAWEVHSFLRHAGFYRCFIKNLNKIALPLSKLLQKDVEFIFNQLYMEAFQELKKRLTSTPILQAPN